MLTLDNLPELFNALGFEKKEAVYQKMVGGAVLEVDFSLRTIRYPEASGLLVHERQTCNFDANENFVVLECVHRLLAKGYKPEHIELEPKWKLGRGASGGRADILVKDHTGRPLLIIECKTAGSEFQRAWNKTRQDGDQLFSYAQQISETQFLCLYTSDLEAGKLGYTSHIIAHRDNEKYLQDKQISQSFKTASNVKERFAVWLETYKQDFTTKGIFENNIQPYFIGKDKYSLEDLNFISADDQQKKYHEFATILRQHNVSGRENAFDKLVNLFLCKLVDEIQNPSDLKFYWKGVAYDTHFDLMDRLQQLYQAGMEKFLGEEITYINQADVNNAMRFIRKDPDATQRQVWALFIRQKFFTNNDFSFINVHNQKLFYQNAEVLLKILQMWQDVRLTNPQSHNQFLGDMFEGFLDQGIKQSEGQFFTPMPICRFVLMSLPLASMVEHSGTPPKAIDYACGAGHFLNELALQLKPLVEKYQSGTPLENYHRALFGIEKEYRLSKVAKVSAFMYGQENINICYGDALVHHHAAFPGIEDGTFDLLVANPPYSVSGFLETLPESERQAYTLTETVKDLETASSIETFFIERAQQLLRADGVAAIILPSSILSNGNSVYIRTREILLQYFDIVAVAEFGSGTFGKTGTNTVTLFLRRKKTSPDTAIHYRERVQAWFSRSGDDGHTAAIYQDEPLLAQYAAHIQVPLEDYKSLLQNHTSGPWEQHTHFEVYQTRFNDSTEVANLYKAKWFKALTEIEQEAEINQRYLAFVRAIEQDKLYHFIMASDQPHPVLIIRSPTDTKEQKRFLGYEWSAAKGNEGIKISKNAQGQHSTPLYDEANRNNTEKINALVTANFNNTLTKIPLALQEVARTSALVDMLDFSAAIFDKQINVASKATITTKSIWPLVKLEALTEINPSSANPIDLFGVDEFVYVDIGSVESKTGRVLYDQFLKPADAPSRARRLVQNKDILLSTVRPNLQSFALLKNVPNKVVASTGFAVLRPNPNLVLPEFLIETLFSDFLLQQMIAKMGKGQYPSINQADIDVLQIILPPIDIQQKIVAECEDVEAEVVQAKNLANKTKNAIDLIIDEISIQAQLKTLNQIADLSRGASPRPIDAFLTEESDGIAWIKIGDVAPGEKYIRTAAQKITQAGAVKSRRVYPEDFIISNSMSVGRPYIVAIEGCVHDGWLILANISKEINKDYLYYMISGKFVQQQFQEKALGGVVQNLNIDRAKSVQVPIPSLKMQEKTVAEIFLLERDIAAAQVVIDSAPARKQAILTQYL